jgi:hypothetical protein
MAVVVKVGPAADACSALLAWLPCEHACNHLNSLRCLFV